MRVRGGGVEDRGKPAIPPETERSADSGLGGGRRAKPDGGPDWLTIATMLRAAATGYSFIGHLSGL
jgi:hypothetical protein